MKSNNIFFSMFLFLGIVSNLKAQDLLEKLNQELKNVNQYEIATFKTTRIAISQSVETRKKGIVEFSIGNRYWDKPNNTEQSFLADEVSRRFGLNYAITDRFTAGFGYTNFDDIYDGYFKYQLLKQKTDIKKSPVSVTLYQNFTKRNKQIGPITAYNENTGNYAFTSQILIAHKFNPRLSVQLSPTLINNGSSVLDEDPNTQFAIGFGARHKIGLHASIVSEYYYVANPIQSIETYEAFLVGINWELSYIQLQFHMTNARNFAEDLFITQTRNNFNFKDGAFHFGFNATFVIDFNKNKL